MAKRSGRGPGQACVGLCGAGAASNLTDGFAPTLLLATVRTGESRGEVALVAAACMPARSLCGVTLGIARPSMHDGWSESGA